MTRQLVHLLGLGFGFGVGFGFGFGLGFGVARGPAFRGASPRGVTLSSRLSSRHGGCCGGLVLRGVAKASGGLGAGQLAAGFAFRPRVKNVVLLGESAEVERRSCYAVCSAQVCRKC